MPRNFFSRRVEANEQKASVRKYKCKGCGLRWPQFGTLCRACWRKAGEPITVTKPGGHEPTPIVRVAAADLVEREDKVYVVGDGQVYFIVWDGT